MIKYTVLKSPLWKSENYDQWEKAVDEVIIKLGYKFDGGLCDQSVYNKEEIRIDMFVDVDGIYLHYQEEDMFKIARIAKELGIDKFEEGISSLNEEKYYPWLSSKPLKHP